MLAHKSFIAKANDILHSYISTADKGTALMFYADFAEFRLVNHFYGLEKGDALLRAVENYLDDIPEVVLFERVFSDQFLFVVITRAPRTKEEIISSYNRYTAAFLNEQAEKYPACFLRIYCGISPILDDIIDAIENANIARMEAKKSGAMEAVLFDQAMLKQLYTHRELEREISLALREKRFVFYLQPKVDLLTGEIVGAEALARRVQPDGQVIYPDSFCPIMEENGSIVDLDILMLRQVCECLNNRRKKGLPVVRTAVNLSHRHMHNPDSADIFHSIAQEYHIPPELLEFELTETILLNEFSEAKELTDKLRSLHYHVSIDDFGSGYAGNNIWQKLTFDTLKLDRSFLSGNDFAKTRNAAILPNLINISQKIGVDVICEGVEQEEQCWYLLQMGCRLVQGYLFSQPVPADQFYQMYQEQNGHYQLSFISPQPCDRIGNNSTDKRAKKRISPVPKGLCLSLFGTYLLSTSLCILMSFIIQQRITLITIIDIMIMTLGTILFGMFYVKKKLSLDDQRYLLLENFSDTILFIYDCKKDIMRFTPNLTNVIQTDHWIYKNFSKRLNESNVYPGDHSIVKRVLSGHGSKSSDIRIRLKHKPNEQYSWSLINYKYVYDSKRIVSIIGKLTDIDEQIGQVDRSTENTLNNPHDKELW